MPNNGFIRVFLSSTFLDLQDRRSLVMRTVESFPDLKCTAMERFTASTRPALEDCLRAVRKSKLYIGILAYRYGWVPEGETKSITELEHDEAVKVGIPRLMFVVDTKSRPPIEDQDMDQGPDKWDRRKQLEAFKDRLGSTGVTPRPFGGDAELVLYVSQALHEWCQEHGLGQPAAGAESDLEPQHEQLVRYREALLAEHSDLPMVGFGTKVRVTMGLDELFVPLRAERILRCDALDGEAKEMRGKRPEQHPEPELPFAIDPKGHPTEGPATVFALARRERKRVVLVKGEPGSGKTSLLRRLTNSALTHEAKELLGLGNGTAELLPIFLPLRKLTAGVLEGGLGTAIHHCLPAHARLDASFCDWMATERGDLLVMLDGLDEVPAELRDDVAAWVRGLAQEDASSWFVVSTRPAGYTAEAKEALGDAAVEFKIKPFEDEQVEAFVHRWYAIVERAGSHVDWEQRAEEAASDLLGRLRKQQKRAQRVLDMTANPLLLTVVCLIHKDRGSHLPEHRERLYRESAEVLLEGWRQAKNLEVSLSSDASHSLLEPVAGFLHDDEGRTSATESELLEVLAGPLREVGWTGTPAKFLFFLRDDSGIFCGESNDRYKFLHLGLQEYFAARSVRGQFAEWAFEQKDEAEALLDGLVDKFGESWWQEVFLLLFALPEKPNLFVPFFDRLLTSRPAVVAEQETLVRDCLEEAQRASPRPFAKYLDRVLPNPPSSDRAAVVAVVRLLMAKDWGAAGVEVLLERSRVRLIVRHAPRESAEVVLGLVRERRSELLPELERLFAEREDSGSAPRRHTRDQILRTHEPSGVRLVTIPAGTFTMGSTKHGDEQPPHQVEVEAFELAETPVTNAQYRAFVEATGHPAPGSWKDRGLNADEQPVVTVSWEDAQAFCDWAGMRLPSEAQWEYACRARSETEYWFGDDAGQLGDYAWFSGNSGGSLQPVGQKPANPFGLHDMHGNVWEWCQDAWHDNYKKAPKDGTAWEAGGSGFRVLRGGSFGGPAEDARSAFRSFWQAEIRFVALGFRPARPLH